MRTPVTNGDIEPGGNYQVFGGSIVYNGITYNNADEFVGVDGETTYTVDSGTPQVVEYSKIYGLSAEAVENPADIPPFSEESKITGLSAAEENPNVRFIPLVVSV